MLTDSIESNNDEDVEKIFIIDHEQLQSDKNAGWTLIGIPEKPD